MPITTDEERIRASWYRIQAMTLQLERLEQRLAALEAERVPA